MVTAPSQRLVQRALQINLFISLSFLLTFELEFRNVNLCINTSCTIYLSACCKTQQTLTCGLIIISPVLIAHVCDTIISWSFSLLQDRLVDAVYNEERSGTLNATLCTGQALSLHAKSNNGLFQNAASTLSYFWQAGRRAQRRPHKPLHEICIDTAAATETRLRPEQSRRNTL